MLRPTISIKGQARHRYLGSQVLQALVCLHHFSGRSQLQPYSTANPWLDFLTPSEAESLAVEMNNDLEEFCSSGPSLQEASSLKRLYGFGLLPLVPGTSVASLLNSVKQVASLPHLKGIIMGSKGIGKGLDDDNLEPLWGALSEAGLVVFLHPHYGIDGKAWGEKENGHVLPVALGFPFESTIVRGERFALVLNTI